MNQDDVRARIERAWEERDAIGPDTDGDAREAVETALSWLDAGVLRVAEPGASDETAEPGASDEPADSGASDEPGATARSGVIGAAARPGVAPVGWTVHEWLKKAVLLSFRLRPNLLLDGPAGTPLFDKVPLKFADWDAGRFRQAGVRAVPGAVVRRPAHIGRNVVLMPCFVNVGAHVGDGTMVDTWATIGSCAQIGRNCHVSGGAGIGGVLEPLQAAPVIIEDDCFIGARAEVAEGVHVGRGAVLAMGVFLGASTRIVDRATGRIHLGHVPPYSVVVPGAMPGRPLPDGTAGPSLGCAVIVKTVDARTRARTAINELLRD